MATPVLIADDDAMIRDVVKSILEAEGYVVTVATDGAAAAKILDEAPRPLPFKFAVLDVMMPGLSGLDLLTRMKLHQHTRDLPVIMLTGEAKPTDILAGYEIGADYYITKPFTRAQLLAGIEILFTPQE